MKRNKQVYAQAMWAIYWHAAHALDQEYAGCAIFGCSWCKPCVRCECIFSLYEAALDYADMYAGW